MCQVKIARVVRYPVRIQASLVVPRSGGTASKESGVMGLMPMRYNLPPPAVIIGLAEIIDQIWI